MTVSEIEARGVTFCGSVGRGTGAGADGTTSQTELAAGNDAVRLALKEICLKSPN